MEQWNIYKNIKHINKYNLNYLQDTRKAGNELLGLTLYITQKNMK